MESPNPKPPSPPHASDATTAGRHSSAPTTDPRLEKLRSLLLRCAIASTPTKSLTPQQKTFVEKRIEELFPTISTPDHPPYAWMVEDAIRELNEEEGSTEEAISEFIVQKYKQLPFAHSVLLKHHLGKLCESGNLVETHSHCYLNVKPTIPNRTSNHHPRVTSLSIRAPSPCPSPSSSPSFSPTYASSSTSSSCQSFNLKKNRGKRKKSYKTQRGRGKGKGRGKGRGRSWGKRGGRTRGRGRGGETSSENMMVEVYEDKVEDEVHVHQIQCLTGDAEMANESFQGKEQPQAPGVDVENQAGESTMIIEIESREQEYRVSEERAQPLQLEKVGKEANSPITEVCLVNDDATANRIEGENEYFGGLEQEDDDVLDGLIEEVYSELVEASQIDDQAPEDNLQNPDNHLVQASQESVNVEQRAEPSTGTGVIAVETQQQEHMVSDEKMKKECSKVWLQQGDVMGEDVLQTGEQSPSGDGGDDIETRETQHKINHQAEQTCETNNLQVQDQLNVGDLEVDVEKKMCEGDCPATEEECHDIKKSSDASTEVKPVEDSSTLQSMEKPNQTRQLRPRPPKGQSGLTRLEQNQESNQHYKLRPRPLTTKPQLRKRSSKTQK